jgi:hypothetical protein
VVLGVGNDMAPPFPDVSSLDHARLLPAVPAAIPLAAAGFALPGTLTVRAYACGKPSCRCHAEPPRLHGPYAEWTRKIGGKTVTRRLSPAELTEYQPLFDNAKKLRALLAELQDLTLEIIEADSRQEP